MDNAGADDGLAIDNFSFVANLGATLHNLTWNVGSGTWDTTTANWVGDATTFSAGDNVNFSNATGGTVTVVAGGVAPHNVIVSATSGTYTFQNTGGDTNGIAGGATASLAKSGAGILVLASPNTYGGGTAVTGGTVQISNDNQLGAAAGVVSLDGGATLATTAAITTGRALTVGTGGAVLATNGNAFTQNGTSALNGVLTIAGAAPVDLKGLVNFGTTGALNIGTGSSVTLSVPSGTMTMNAGGVFDGDLILNTTALVRFNGTATYGGAGKIKVLGSAIGAGSAGVEIAAGALPNFNALITSFQAATLTSDLVLNPTGTGHAAFVPGDVTTPTYKTASYLIFLASTGSTFTLNGKITGESDLFFGSSSTTGGGTTGTVVLNAASDYLGNTLFNMSSVVELGVTNALPVTTNVVFNSLTNSGAGSLDLHGFNQQVVSLSSEALGTPALSTIINLGTAPSIFTVSGSVTPAHGFSGVLADGSSTLALVKAGSSKLTLSGTNTYSGGTTVNGGTLQVVKAGSLPGHTSPGNVTIGATASLILNVGGSGEWTDTDIDAVRTNVTFSGTPIINLDTSNATSPASYVSALNTALILTKLGANTLTLSDAATAATVTTLTTSGGVTEIGAALGTGTSTVNANAATTFTASQTLSALNIGAGAVVTLGATTTPFTGDFAVVPEPGSLGLLALGSLGLLGRRRR